ncbi:hypothetical protein BDN72DRAFT_36621 [Pluteus cervinus]|uniref:Uncharacterized protein n=1 Tax=Pluteus cervinus TaxID=181527 RepID=A0ACD3BGX3_9AGAR|nr:hypothetical protein BDN72DRAFT_36621 [Pluteus cervinus]
MGDSMSAPTSTPPSFQSHRNSPNVYAQPPMSAPSILVTFHPDAGASREELYEPLPHPGPIRLPNTPPPLSDRETRTRRSQDYRPTNFHPPYAYSVPSHAGSVASSYRSLSSKSSAVPSVHSRSTQSSTTGPRPLHLPKRLVMPAPLQPSVASSRSSVRSSRPPAQVQDMGMRERLPPPIAAPRPPYYGPPANRPQVIPIGPNGPNRLRKRPSEAVHASVPRTAPPVPSVPSTSLFAHVAHHQTAAGTNKPQPSFHVKADKTGKKVLAKRRT